MQNKKSYPLNQSPLYKLRSKRKLSGLVGLTPTELVRLARTADSLYTEFSVTKKSGGLRGVENPHRQLKLVQAKIARLLGRITPPDYLFCPVKGRCYVRNAAQHRGQRVVRCLDIRRYFPSTASRRVYWFFRAVMQCETDIAAVLTRLATYDGHLPTGSPLSPIMAYFAHYDVWERVSDICKENGYRLTVYIDDVTISAASISPVVLWDIKRAIHGGGLRYHKEKHYVDRPSEITGVIVRGNEIYTPNRQLKKLRGVEAAFKDEVDRRNQEKLGEVIGGLKGQIAQVSAVRATF